LLLDLQYELPCRKDTDTFTVNEGVVRGEIQLARGLTSADVDAEDELEKPAEEPAATDDEGDGEAAPERESA